MHFALCVFTTNYDLPARLDFIIITIIIRVGIVSVTGSTINTIFVINVVSQQFTVDRVAATVRGSVWSQSRRG